MAEPHKLLLKQERNVIKSRINLYSNANNKKSKKIIGYYVIDIDSGIKEKLVLYNDDNPDEIAEKLRVKYSITLL